MTQTQKKHRIVLIHATPVSIAPIRAAFEQQWPEADTVNLLDDALGRDLDTGNVDRQRIARRIYLLGDYAVRAGADAILYSCSAFGKEIDAAKRTLPVPVLKPNEAMFEEALDTGAKIGMIATFRPSIPSMEQEFNELRRGLHTRVHLDSIFVDGAMDALAGGDPETHNRLIREASTAFAGYGVVMLAQFSASLAAQEVQDQLGCPVLTSPGSAVRKLKTLLMG